MFDFVRQHKRIMQLLLVILIFPSFVLFGIDGYKRFTTDAQVLAVVDGHDIVQTELDKAVQEQTARVLRQSPGIDLKVFDTPAFKAQVLEQLINERTLQLAANKFNVWISDQKLAEVIRAIPELRAAQDTHGNIQKETYAALLSAQGMTPASYEAKLRANLSTDRLAQAVSASFISEALKPGQTAWAQNRTIGWTHLNPYQLVSSIVVTEEDLKTHFAQNQHHFQAQETIEGEWIGLDVAQIAAQTDVKLEDAKSYYQQNIQSYSQPEQRRARHILIATKSGISAAEIEKAKQKAEELRKQVQTNPASFEATAKLQSEDAGSAKQGGDLGFFTQKDMVKPFADAAFALQKGEISTVVQSEFGFHVIQLMDIKPGQSQAFESVRQEIERRLKSQMAQKKFTELAEQFTNLVYEQPDSLGPIAKQLGLELKSFPMTAKTQVGQLPEPLKHPKVIEALFSHESMTQKKNTSAIEVGSFSLVSARVIRHQPQRQLQLEEARDAVTAHYKLAQAKQKAKVEAQELVKSENMPLKETAVVSRMSTGGLNGNVIEAVMRQPTQRLPVRTMIDEADAGFYVVEVRAVNANPMQANVEQMSKILMERTYADAQFQAYVQSLRQQFKVKVKSVPATSKEAVVNG